MHAKNDAISNLSCIECMGKYHL